MRYCMESFASGGARARGAALPVGGKSFQVS